MELLEQQRSWLIDGLRTLYTWSSTGQGWRAQCSKPSPKESPSIHEILSAIGVLSENGQKPTKYNAEAFAEKLTDIIQDRTSTSCLAGSKTSDALQVGMGYYWVMTIAPAKLSSLISRAHYVSASPVMLMMLHCSLIQRKSLTGDFLLLKAPGTSTP